MKIIRLRPRGQLTLPKDLRERVGLKEDAPLRIGTEAGRIILEPVEFYPYPTRDYTQREISRFLKEDRLPPKLAEKFKDILEQN